MTTPAFVNIGARQNSAGATSRNPALPASLVNGNILICEVVSKNGATHSVSGAGWQQLHTQQFLVTALTVSRWWRVVDGTEASPTVSWSGSVNCYGQIMQYSGVDPTTPVGGTSHSTGSGSPHTTTGFNTTANNSLATYWDVCVQNTAVATPSGWAEDWDAGSATGTTRNAGGSKAIATSGTSTGNISVTAGSNNWIQSQIELLEASGGSSQNLSPSLFTRTKTIYAPAVSQPQVLSPALVTRSKSLYAPTVAVGSVTLAPSLVTRSKSLFAPLVTPTYTLTAPLLTRLRSIYTPVVTTSNELLPGLLSRSKSIYGPAITVGSVTLLPGLLTRSRTIYAPSVTQGAVTIAPPLLSRTKGVYAPTVSRGAVALFPGLVTRSKTIHAPVVSISTATKDIYPPLLSRVGTGQDNKRMWRSFTESFAA